MLIINYVSSGRVFQYMQRFLMENYDIPYLGYEERHFTYIISPHATRRVYNDAKGLGHYVIGTARFTHYFTALSTLYTKPNGRPFVTLWGDLYKTGKIARVRPPRNEEDNRDYERCS